MNAEGTVPFSKRLCSKELFNYYCITLICCTILQSIRATRTEKCLCSYNTRKNGDMVLPKFNRIRSYYILYKFLTIAHLYWVYRPPYHCYIRQPLTANCWHPAHCERTAVGTVSSHNTKANQLTAAAAGLLYKEQHTDMTCVPDSPRCCLSDVETTPVMCVTREGMRGTETGEWMTNEGMKDWRMTARSKE